ncbi:MAG TPA: hypothetical protein VFA04_04235 [Bryobacteraceae bacterium]|jgi:hypothetical protein|nr:hypothetical protein [Bryobacteraceae bacterium]
MPRHCNSFSDDCLELYALGRLPDAHTIQLEEHLLICDACRDRLAQTERFIAALRRASDLLDPEAPAIPKPILSSPTRLAQHRSPMLFAAALVLMTMAPAFRPATPILPRTSASLVTVRDAEPSALPVVDAALTTDLTLDVSRSVRPLVWKVTLVNSRGAAKWTANVRSAGETVRISIGRPLGAGTYWVRLYDAGAPSELVREFGFRIR